MSKLEDGLKNETMNDTQEEAKKKPGFFKGLYNSFDNIIVRNKDGSVKLTSGKNITAGFVAYLLGKKMFSGFYESVTGVPFEKKEQNLTEKLFHTIFSNPLKKAALIGIAYVGLQVAEGPATNAWKEFKESRYQTLVQQIKASDMKSDKAQKQALVYIQQAKEAREKAMSSQKQIETYKQEISSLEKEKNKFEQLYSQAVKENNSQRSNYEQRINNFNEQIERLKKQSQNTTNQNKSIERTSSLEIVIESKHRPTTRTRTKRTTFVEYTVNKGDTFWNIMSEQYGKRNINLAMVYEAARDSSIRNPNRLEVGDRIKLRADIRAYDNFRGRR